MTRVEVAFHIQKKSVCGISISLNMMEVASPFLFRGWSWHPHFCSEGGCVKPISFKKVQVATSSHLEELRLHPNRFSVGSDMPLLFLIGWRCPSTSFIPCCVTSHSQLSSFPSTAMICHHISRTNKSIYLSIDRFIYPSIYLSTDLFIHLLCRYYGSIIHLSTYRCWRHVGVHHVSIHLCILGVVRTIV